MQEETKKKSVIARVCGGLWCTIEASRRIFVNALFIALIVFAIALALGSGGPDIEDGSALVLAPVGSIVEQLSGDPMQRAIDELRGVQTDETLLKDLLDAIDLAREDERIAVLVLDLSAFRSAGMSKLQELRTVIRDFKAAGKKVVATADAYGQAAYYLAAQADEVYLHHMGLIVINGFGRYRTYYKDGLDRLGVDVHVFKVGEYKSAVEPYLRNDMSTEAEEANLDWLGDLWQVYLADVAEARGMSAEDFETTVCGFQERLEAAGGDAAQAALDAGLIDGAVTRDAVRDRLIELVGEDEENSGYQRVGMGAFLEEVGGDRLGTDASGDLVGVVVARGDILDGSQPPGRIGGDSTAALIRQAREDEQIKAVVLRVDSGGGSAFASEIIRRELALAREDGKPVVVSMGSVAASGGYWISMASDEIWASPTTITGSIGIFGIFPTFQRPLERYLGMRVDGVGTTPLAGAFRADRELAPEVGAMIQSIIDRGYEEFLATVAEGRDMSPEDVDAVARGRVWSGEDALAHGLVDHLGGLGHAVAAAAELAGIGDEYAVRYIEKELDFKEQMMAELVARMPRTAAARSDLTAGLADVLHQVGGPVLSSFNDPHGRYAHSLIESD